MDYRIHMQVFNHKCILSKSTSKLEYLTTSAYYPRVHQNSNCLLQIHPTKGTSKNSHPSVLGQGEEQNHLQCYNL